MEKEKIQNDNLVFFYFSACRSGGDELTLEDKARLGMSECGLVLAWAYSSLFLPVTEHLLYCMDYYKECTKFSLHTYTHTKRQGIRSRGAC